MLYNQCWNHHFTMKSRSVSITSENAFENNYFSFRCEAQKFIVFLLILIHKCSLSFIHSFKFSVKWYERWHKRCVFSGSKVACQRDKETGKLICYNFDDMKHRPTTIANENAQTTTTPTAKFSLFHSSFNPIKFGFPLCFFFSRFVRGWKSKRQLSLLVYVAV